jgi:regulator of PEP synthase PpsR (kinase-PPPase family)
VTTVAHVQQAEQINEAVARAAASGGTLVHTLVDPGLRRTLVDLAQERGVVEVDLMGPLMTRLAEVLNRTPLAHPGLYRQLHEAYFDRIAAIEYSMAHDDGRNPSGWARADIVLTGISRVGKTPLSMYLAVLGWKVANVPLVMDLPTPPGLFEVDRRRVIGLTMEPGQLVFHRKERRSRLGVPGLDDYTDSARIYEETEAARQVFRRSGFSVIDVTDTPIEASAERIVEIVTRRFGSEAHRP